MHRIGKAAVAYGTDPTNQGGFYAARHRHHHGEGPTPQAAIKAVRKARKAYEQSEREEVDVVDLVAAEFSHGQVTDFVQFNKLNPDFVVTRADLRRIVTHPDRKAHNWATYRHQLARLGILISKPKAPAGTN